MLIKLVIASLACYRIAQLFVFDDGPFCVFDRIRIWVGRYDYGADGKSQTGLGRLLSCPYCVGLWLAIPLAFTFLPETIIDFLMFWFAIAGGQAFLEGISITRKNE
jgi:hypothetical protein